MAAALVQGKTWRMFFIRHRQCSVYSLKLSDSCLSWTQEGPSVIASFTLAVRHFWLNQKPWWMSVKSWANEVTCLQMMKGCYLTERRLKAENLPGRPSQRSGPTLHRWSSGGAAAGSSTPSGSDGGCCSTASDCSKSETCTFYLTPKLSRLIWSILFHHLYSHNGLLEGWEISLHSMVSQYSPSWRANLPVPVVGLSLQLHVTPFEFSHVNDKQGTICMNSAKTV